MISNFEKAANYRTADTAQSDLGIQRSRGLFHHEYATTLNAGDLIPLGAPREILPGDSIDVFKQTVFCRMATPIFPVMDDCFLDVSAFFVPARLLWDHWPNMFGQNDDSSWASDQNFTVPTINPAVNGPDSSLWNLWGYFGLPCYDGAEQVDFEVSALPFRGYRKVWNDWYRNQNVSAPVLVNTGDVESDETLFDLLKVSRIHDRFSDCLPAPQKGESVLIPGLYGLPVGTSQSTTFSNSSAPSLRLNTVGGVTGMVSQSLATNAGGAVGGTGSSSAPSAFAYPANLAVVGDGATTGATINSLRMAFQIQKIFESDGYSGSRYTEMLRSVFGCVPSDQTLQRAEFLGTHRIMLNMKQIEQTSSTDGTSPLGTVGGVSRSSESFTFAPHAFNEYGYLYLVGCIRTARSYAGGIHRSFTRTSRFDFYDPRLANIPNQPVYVYELANVSPSTIDDAVFGYQEAWSEYREFPSFKTGSLYPGLNSSLDAWTYVDSYSDSPVLSESWMLETDENVARTLAVPSTDGRKEQFILDCSFDWTMSRPIPTHSIPGLVDHF